jgi:predicted CxxxxCH...CXXCH cytochrome family protein
VIVLALAALGVSVVAACSEDRAAPAAGGGAHPPGWATKGDPAFHAEWLKSNKFQLSRCQTCHGADYLGGAVGNSCSKTSCHSAPDSGAPIPPSDCSTCHGTNGTARPSTGAHQNHAGFCDTCHTVPTPSQIEQHASGDPSQLVHFGGIAAPSPTSAPVFDRATKVCTNTYCHGASSPAWTNTAKLACDGCHKAPPQTHARWSRVSTTPASCATCHPAQGDARHVNGKVDVTVTSCTACHGAGNHANPPVALDGTTATTSRGVGAHDRHLDGDLSDRISSPLPCNDCHVVPASITEKGHLDQSTTTVRFPAGGTYDAKTQSCTVFCHFDNAAKPIGQAPVWTDASGAARKCDACHAFPPVTTRAGGPHPTVAGDVAECRRCHQYAPATHVNGVVDFVTP